MKFLILGAIKISLIFFQAGTNSLFKVLRNIINAQHRFRESLTQNLHKKELNAIHASFWGKAWQGFFWIQILEPWEKDILYRFFTISL